MKYTFLSSGIISAIVISVSAPAHANDENGRIELYGGPTFHHGNLVNGLGAVIDDSGFNFIRQSDNGIDLDGEIGGVIGLEFERAVDLGTSWGFDRFYGGISGEFADVNANRRIVLGPDDFLDVLPINGDISPGAIASGEPVTLNANVEYWRSSVHFGLSKPLADDEGYWGLGIYASVSKTDINSKYTNVNDASQFISLNEDVDAFAVGPEITARFERPITDRLSSFVNASAAILYMNGELDARQTSSLLPPINVSDSEHIAAVRGKVKAGFNYAIRQNISLSFFGALEAGNDHFEVANPRSAPGLSADDPASYHPKPAHLEQTGLVTGTIGLSLKLTF